MRNYFTTLLLVISTATWAQKQMSDPRPFAKTITAADLKKHLYVIAGPDMEGRETATEGQRKAATYIENHFRLLGLRAGNNGSYQLNYPVYSDSLTGAQVQVNDQSFVLDKDFSVNVNGAHPATLMATEVVFVKGGRSDSAQDDYQGIDARGKIVLVIPADGLQASGRARMMSQMTLQEAALKNGAAALLLLQGGFPRALGSTRGSLNVTGGFRKTIYPNIFYVSDSIASAIMGNDLAAAKNGQASSKSYPRNMLLSISKETRRLQSSNVIAYIEGTDKKDEYLFITAHYDHLGKRGDVIYYGADDDGSGTVSVLELAQAFAKAKAAGEGPRRTVVFMTVSGEEKGLWGSAYYAEHPVFATDSTTADLNIDMIGRIDPKRKERDSMNYVYVVGDSKLSSELHTISEATNRKYMKMALDYKFNDPNDPERIYYRSDHFNFARKGIPIIFYFDGIHNDYHRPTDTPDKILYDLMAKRVQLVFYTAWEIANRDSMLKRDIPF